MLQDTIQYDQLQRVETIATLPNDTLKVLADSIHVATKPVHQDVNQHKAEEQPLLRAGTDSIKPSPPHPFEYTLALPNDTLLVLADSMPIAIEEPVRQEINRHKGKELPFFLESVDSIFVFILFCFLFFTHIYNGGIGFLKDNFRSLFSTNINQRTPPQLTIKEKIFSYFLVFQALLFIAVCIYTSFTKCALPIDGTRAPFITILLIIVLLAVFLLGKTLMYRLIGFVCDMPALMRMWERTYYAIFAMLGIIYFIPTLLLIYSDYIHTILIGFILIVLLVMHLVLFYKLISYFVTEKLNFLYLIAYLCTVEILPILFLAIGLIYLYRLDIYNLLWLLK